MSWGVKGGGGVECVCVGGGGGGGGGGVHDAYPIHPIDLRWFKVNANKNGRVRDAPFAKYTNQSAV